MPLVTSPTTLNNGADHIFTQVRAVLQPSGDIGAEWVELLSTDVPKPNITVRSRKLSGDQIQHSIQIRDMATEEDGLTQSEILFSASLFRTTGQAQANTEAVIKLFTALCAKAGFYVNLHNRSDS